MVFGVRFVSIGYMPPSMTDRIEKIVWFLEEALWDRIISRLWAIRCATDVQLSVQKEHGHLREQLRAKYADDTLRPSF